MRYRTFISHAWSYKETYWAIRRMLDRATANYAGFDYIDYSIPDHNPILNKKGRLQMGPRLLNKAITNRISQSSVILVPARMFINHSGWVQEEIKYSKRIRKCVIAVRSRKTIKTPQSLTNLADHVVDANYRSLYNAITG